jgi:hypothetical protein
MKTRLRMIENLFDVFFGFIGNRCHIDCCRMVYDKV